VPVGAERDLQLHWRQGRGRQPAVELYVRLSPSQDADVAGDNLPAGSDYRYQATARRIDWMPALPTSAAIRSLHVTDPAIPAPMRRFEYRCAREQSGTRYPQGEPGFHDQLNAIDPDGDQ
jgi:hypothetical protein